MTIYGHLLYYLYILVSIQHGFIANTMFALDSKSVVSKQKCIDYIEKWPFMVIFLINL